MTNLQPPSRPVVAPVASDPPQLRHPGGNGGLWWTLVLVLVVLGGGVSVYLVRSHHRAGEASSPATAGAPGAPGAAPAPASGQKPGSGAARAIPVVASRTKRGDLPIYLTEIGTVTPLATVVIRSRVDGQLMHIGFSEGQQVKAGDVLAEIDPRPFAAQVKQTEGQLVKDQAQLDNARVDLKRYQSASAIFTEQQTVTQQATVAQAEGVVESDQGQLDNARLQLSYCRITATMDGRVGLRLVDQGNMVHASDANGLAVLAVEQPITVVFTIGQDDIPNVLMHMKSGPALTVDAYSRDLTHRLAQGTLVAIDNQVDPGSGTVRLRANFDNRDGLLFPNQFVNVKLLIETRRDVVLAPNAAIQLSPTGSYVYVVSPDNEVAVRTITIGASEGGMTIVSDGLQGDETVVTDGVDKLKAGSKVQLRGAGEGAGPAAGAAPAAGKSVKPAAQPDGAPATLDGSPAKPDSSPAKPGKDSTR
jgi:multidrug efflux system membrane fusion protein